LEESSFSFDNGLHDFVFEMHARVLAIPLRTLRSALNPDEIRDQWSAFLCKQNVSVEAFNRDRRIFVRRERIEACHVANFFAESVSWNGTLSVFHPFRLL